MKRVWIPVVFILLLAVPASAWHDPGLSAAADDPDGMLVTDGSYVMNIGELQLNITNHGLIGSQYSIVSSYSDAPSGQWPSSSGNEYLFAAGLWVGGIKNGQTRVSTGQFEAEIRPRAGYEHTIYEAKYGRQVRPHPGRVREGARNFEPGADDDRDGRRNEDPLNGLDDDGDGLIDEDFEMWGNQMMVCTLYDNTEIAAEMYPDHEALDLKVVQTAFAWETDQYDDFVVIRYDITNIGASRIDDVYVGMMMDADIGPRDEGGGAFDDLPGRYTGMARASNGIFESVDVAYMFDQSKRCPLPGYFGVMFRSSRIAMNAIHSYQYYTGQQAYALGGDPMNDAERYNDMSRPDSDSSRPPDYPGDYRLLASNGPWGTLFPGRWISLEVIFVCGDGLEGMLENCANAQQAFEGAWFDLDQDQSTGRQGRETLVCLEDLGFTLLTFAASPMVNWTAAYADYSCLPPDFIDPITPEDLFRTEDDRHCIWINFDNCEECENIKGSPCGKSQFQLNWNCSNEYLSVDMRPHCTGIAGRESIVRWLIDSTPLPPTVRIWAEDFKVHLYWSDESESERDLITDHTDFEGYQVWRADGWDRPMGTNEESGPASSLWTQIAQCDLINDYVDFYDYHDGVSVRQLPLGQNSGLDGFRYTPPCLVDYRFNGLATVIREFLAEGRFDNPENLPPLRDLTGAVIPGMEPFLAWEAYPAEMDTFYWAEPFAGDPDAGIPAKAPKHYYEYIDRDVNNGFLYFYAVTTSDHSMVTTRRGSYLTGPGNQGDPSVFYQTARPGTKAQSAASIQRNGPRIYVYPNPATREALAKFQQMQPNSDDPTGVRVMFTNLPQARSTIRIYTLNGDLVQVLEHDGLGGVGDASWNLISRNGQEVASGLYIYTVNADDPQFKPFMDKFVIIR